MRKSKRVFGFSSEKSAKNGNGEMKAKKKIMTPALWNSLTVWILWLDDGMGFAALNGLKDGFVFFRFPDS